MVSHVVARAFDHTGARADGEPERARVQAARAEARRAAVLHVAGPIRRG